MITLPSPTGTRVQPVKTNVLYIWAITALSIFVIALLWFILDATVGQMLDLQSTLYPTEMSDSGVTFVSTVWTYWPVFALIGLGIWVAIMSQKKRVNDLRGE